MFSLRHTFLSMRLGTTEGAVPTQSPHRGTQQHCVRLLMYWQRLVTAWFRATVRKSSALVSNDAGMSTIEYAMGSLAAAALAGVLYAVIQGGAVVDAIEGIITDALSNSPS